MDRVRLWLYVGVVMRGILLRFLNPYAVIAIVISALIAWTFWPREKPPVGVSTPLPPAKEVRTVEKVRTEVKVVYLYRKEIKKKLNLPDPVVNDDNKQAFATGKLDAEERQYTLTGVLDTQTGQSEIYARPDPLPWIAPGRRGAVGVAYGLQNGQPNAKAYAWHDLLQIKTLHAGARGEIDQTGDNFVGGYVEYRF